MSNQEVYEKCIGAQVTGVEYVDSCEKVVLTFEDKRKLEIMLEGDCCSRSFFSDWRQFKEVLYRKIMNIEERVGKIEHDRPDKYDLTQWKFLVFTTDRGHVTIDWRNESNGYYDGFITPTLIEAQNDK